MPAAVVFHELPSVCCVLFPGRAPLFAPDVPPSVVAHISRVAQEMQQVEGRGDGLDNDVVTPTVE